MHFFDVVGAATPRGCVGPTESPCHDGDRRATSLTRFWLVVVGALALTCQAVANERDQAAVDREHRLLTDLGYLPIPVHSVVAGASGAIKLSTVDGSNRHEAARVELGGACMWSVIGWCVDCSVPIADNSVFFNVGRPGTPVKVGDIGLSRGDYVLFANKTLSKVSLEELRAKRIGGQAPKPIEEGAGKSPRAERPSPQTGGRSKSDVADIAVAWRGQQRSVGQRRQERGAAEGQRERRAPASRAPGQPTSEADEQPASGKWPAIKLRLPPGRNDLTIDNNGSVGVLLGLRAADGRGLDIHIGNGSARTIVLPDGQYDIYVQYDNDKANVYQGDSISVRSSSAKLILRSAVGNYSLKKL